MDIRQVNDEAKAIADWIDNMTQDAGQLGYVLIRRLHEHIEAHPAFAPTASRESGLAKPMTDVQARAFAKEIIPFGQHKGMRVGEADLDYLCRLADPSPFVEELKRYLRSPAVRREIEGNDR